MFRQQHIFIFITYEKFILYQFHIQVEGLYYTSGQYFIFCPNINENTRSNDGETLQQWLDKNRIIGTNISIVNELPGNAVKIDEKLIEQNSSAGGYLITRGDFEYEIDLLIPKIFPDYSIGMNHAGAIVSFEEEVSDEGIAELERIFQQSNFPLNCQFQNKDMSNPKEKTRIGNLFQGVSTYKAISKNLTGEIKKLWEEDEESWIDTRSSILGSDLNADRTISAGNLKDKRFKCIIDCSILPPDNIRNYLSLFEQVCVVAPVKDRLETILNGFGITEDELVELVRLDKVQMLMPHSIERYDSKFLEKIIEANKNNAHLSRRITALTITEINKRNPLFFPKVSISEKRLVLSALDETINNLSLDSKIKAGLREAISELGHGWVVFPSAANQHDSYFLSQFGISQILKDHPQLKGNTNFALTLMMVAPSVDLAAATGSVLIPIKDKGFDTTPVSSMIADLYSGVPTKDWVLQKSGYANFAVQDILTIASHIPITELATTFNAAEITRFRELILNISQNETTIDGLSEATEAFNAFVKKYEKNKDTLNTWNVKGFVLGLIGKGMSGVPMASWMLNLMLTNALKYSSKGVELSKLIDHLEAHLYENYPSAVLVSKMRDKIKKKL